MDKQSRMKIFLATRLSKTEAQFSNEKFRFRSDFVNKNNLEIQFLCKQFYDQ